MKDRGLYRAMARLRFLNYRAKIMSVAFIGTHIPLISLAGYFAWQRAASWSDFAATLAVTLAATLIGTAVTLLVLNALMRPVIATSEALRHYRETRGLPRLPTCYTDEVGTLMADAQRTMVHLERSLVLLEDFDPATDLPNRSGFLKRLARHREEPVVIAALRLADHARLAETFDRDTAERAMHEIGARLRRAAAPDAGLARVGKDAFALRLPHGSEGAAAARADTVEFDLRALLEAAKGDLEIDGVVATPLLLAGHAEQAEGEAAERCLDNALAAAAGASEASPVAFHSAESRQRARDRFQMEQELRAAIRTDAFELHFQPVMDTAAGRPIGAEALLRWNSPERGSVSPAAFIPVAEASGLIDTIGLWVLRRACAEIAVLPAGMSVAVNLSARQFLDPDLDWHVAEALAGAGVDADRLEIELTETTAMVDYDHTRRTFAKLADMGVGMAIDDFGTGYASMSYLRKLPFHKLKIDREFVTDVHRRPGSQAICNAMIELGQGLGLKVLAEGTETAAEVEFLERRGCRLFQGYYFSRPVPSARFPSVAAALGADAAGGLQRAG